VLRKRIHHKFIVGFALAAFVGIFLSTHTVLAATINVDGVVCTLADAITAANTNAAVGGCSAGAAGQDTLILSNNITLSNGLPSITSEIIIQGSSNTVERDPTFTCPDAVNPEFRIFRIAVPGNLTLSNVTVSNGCAHGNSTAGQGGGIYNSGILTIDSASIITGNMALGVCTDNTCSTGAGEGGGIYNDAGTLTIDNGSVIQNIAQGGDALCSPGCSNGPGSGGGIYSAGGSVDVDDGLILRNQALYGVCAGACVLANGFGGGGIYTDGATLSLDTSILDNNYSDDDGGGLYAQGNGVVTVTSSSVSNNDSYDDGAGLYNNAGGSITVTGGSTVFANDAAEDGGGLYNNGSGTVTVANSLVSNNNAGLNGGGIYNGGSGTVSVLSSTVSLNTAGLNGGGLYNVTGTTNVTGSSILNNSAVDGAGIYNDIGGITTVTNSTLSDNLASNDGGGIYNADANVTVTNTTISANRASISGGGIYNYDDNLTPAIGTVVVTSSTLSTNTAFLSGGGIFNDEGDITITNGTISTNVALAAGGGVYNDNLGTTTINNSTVYQNATLGSGDDLNNNSGTVSVFSSIVASGGGGDCAGVITDNGYNIVSDGICGIVPPDPNPATVMTLIDLGGLANNGGVTSTHLPGNWSIAIDNGSCPLLTEDQRGVGFPRPIDVNDLIFPDADPANVGCDVGAIEVNLTLTFDLALQKTTAVITPLTIGDDINFTITVINQGTLDARNVDLIDYIPAGFALSPLDANGWADGGATATNTIAGPIAAGGGSATIDIVLRVQPGATPGAFSNIAEITGAEDDEIGADRTGADSDSIADTTANNDVVVDDVIDNTGGDEDDHDIANGTLAFFDLALSKTTGQIVPVDIGENVTFTITVLNQGSVIAQNVGIIDYIPAGFALSPADTNGWMDGGATATNTIAGPIAVGGSATIDIVLQVQPAAVNSVVVNGAEITSAQDGVGADRTGDDIDSTPGNGSEDDYDQVSVTIEVITDTPTFTPTVTNTPTVTPSPTLTLTPTSTATLTVTPSPTLTLTSTPTLTLTNTPTTTFTVTPTGTVTLLPTSSITPLPTIALTGTPDPSSVALATAAMRETQRAEHLGTLEAAPRVLVYIRGGASVTGGTRVCTDVGGFVTCRDEGTPPPDSETPIVRVLDAPTIDKRSRDGYVLPGGELIYVIIVSNPTGSTVSGITVVDTLPDALTFSGSQTGTVNGQTLTVDVPNLAPLEKYQFDIVTIVNSEGVFASIVNTACMLINGELWECAILEFGADYAPLVDGEVIIDTGEVPIVYEILRVVIFAGILLLITLTLGLVYRRFSHPS
jgi:uncharacterized repeat protein (TIGR01451 family)